MCFPVNFVKFLTHPYSCITFWKSISTKAISHHYCTSSIVIFPGKDLWKSFFFSTKALQKKLHLFKKDSLRGVFSRILRNLQNCALPNCASSQLSSSWEVSRGKWSEWCFTLNHQLLLIEILSCRCRCCLFVVANCFYFVWKMALFGSFDVLFKENSDSWIISN